MAEALGVVASIIQVAGAGATLSKVLYQFVGSVTRADQEIADVASDVSLTVNALNSVSKVFADVNTQSVISRTAVKDAEDLIKRCELIFSEISRIVEKRKKSKGDGLTARGRFAWPFKEERVELLRRRLESLKNSLSLLLHVLQLASVQDKGQIERKALQQELEKIRLLYQREQESRNSLEALESQLNEIDLGNEQITKPVRVLPEVISQQVPTIIPTNKQQTQNSNENPTLGLDNTPIAKSTSNDSVYNAAIKYVQEPEHRMTADDLLRCTMHVRDLLNGINLLQATLQDTNPTRHCTKAQVDALYRNFCKKFEFVIAPSSSSSPLRSAVNPSVCNNGSGKPRVTINNGGGPINDPNTSSSVQNSGYYPDESEDEDTEGEDIVRLLFERWTHNVNGDLEHIFGLAPSPSFRISADGMYV